MLGTRGGLSSQPLYTDEGGDEQMESLTEDEIRDYQANIDWLNSVYGQFGLVARPYKEGIQEDNSEG
jgi:hypothetical protein